MCTEQCERFGANDSSLLPLSGQKSSGRASWLDCNLFNVQTVFEDLKRGVLVNPQLSSISSDCRYCFIVSSSRLRAAGPRVWAFKSMTASTSSGLSLSRLASLALNGHSSRQDDSSILNGIHHVILVLVED